MPAPKGERVDHVATMAIVRQALPEMRLAFGKLPDKILIVRSGDPMWRGGLSAPGSLWLHAQRPLLSENGTSPLLHELTHVITDIRGDGSDDWISEGIAEYYSLDIGHRAGLISARRFALSIKSADTSGAKVEKLRASESARDRTRKAVARVAALDEELRANGATGIDQLTALLAQLTNPAQPANLEVLAGWRARRNDTFLRRLSSKVANGVRSRMLKDHTPDTGCGLKLFARETFLQLPNFDHMHRFLPALVMRNGGAVISVPVNHRARERGASKYGVHNRLWVGIIDLFGVAWLQRRVRLAVIEADSDV